MKLIENESSLYYVSLIGMITFIVAMLITAPHSAWEAFSDLKQVLAQGLLNR